MYVAFAITLSHHITLCFYYFPGLSLQRSEPQNRTPRFARRRWMHANAQNSFSRGQVTHVSVFFISVPVSLYVALVCNPHSTQMRGFPSLVCLIVTSLASLLMWLAALTPLRKPELSTDESVWIGITLNSYEHLIQNHER